MLTMNIKYTDFAGEMVEETHYFNLTPGEFKAFQARHPEIEDGLNMSDQGADVVAFRIMEDFVLSSYGEKSADNRHFVKNEETRENFKNSLAFAHLLYDETEGIMMEPDRAKAFLLGVLPESIASQYSEDLEDFGN